MREGGREGDRESKQSVLETKKSHDLNYGKRSVTMQTIDVGPAELLQHQYIFVQLACRVIICMRAIGMPSYCSINIYSCNRHAELLQHQYVRVQLACRAIAASIYVRAIGMPSYCSTNIYACNWHAELLQHQYICVQLACRVIAASIYMRALFEPCSLARTGNMLHSLGLDKRRRLRW